MSDISPGTLGFEADTGPLLAINEQLERFIRLGAPAEAAIAKMTATSKAAFANISPNMAAGLGAALGPSAQDLAIRKAGIDAVKGSLQDSVKAWNAEAGAVLNAAKAHGAHGAAAYQNSLALMEVTHVSRALFDEIAAGGNPVRGLLMEMGRLQIAYKALSDSGLGVSGAVSMVGEKLGGVALRAAGFITPLTLGATAIVGFGTAALIAASHVRTLRDEMDRAVSGVGHASGLSGEGLASSATTGPRTTGLSMGDGRDVAQSLSSTGRLDPSNIASVMGLTRGYASAFGTDYPTAGQQLGDIFSDPVKGAEKLNERLGFLDDRTRRYIHTLRDQGDAQGAVRALIDASGASMNEQAKPGGTFDKLAAWWSKRNAELENSFAGPTAIERYQHDVRFGGRNGSVDIGSQAEDIRHAGQLRKMQQDDVLSARTSLQVGDLVGRLNPDAGRYRDLQDQQVLLRRSLADPNVVRGMAPGLDSSGKIVSGGDLLADTLDKVNDRLANFMSSTEKQTLSINAQIQTINAWTLGEKLAAATATEMASLGIRQIKTAEELLAVQSKQAEIVAQANDKAYNLSRDATNELALAGKFGLDRSRAEIRQKASDYRDQLTDFSGGSDLEGIGPSFLTSKTAVTGFADALDLATKRLAGFPSGGVGASAGPAVTLSPDDHPLTIHGRGGSLSPGFQASLTRTLGFEGGLNARDTNGTPSNMGINAAAHPGVDVASLTPGGASAIYKQQYWKAIGADSMSPQMARVAFDTAVMQGVGQAMKEIRASSGDASKLMDLREGFESSLLTKNPAKYGPYRNAWADRDAGLRADIGSVSSTNGVLGVKPTAAADIAGWESKRLAAVNIDAGEGIITGASNALAQKKAAFDLQAAAVGKTTTELARYNEVMQTQNALDRAKVEMSPKMRAEVAALGDQAGELAKREAQNKSIVSTEDSIRGFSNSSMDTLFSGLSQGKSAGSLFRGIGFNLGQSLIHSGVGMLTGGLFGKTGERGGGLFGGFLDKIVGGLPQFAKGTDDFASGGTALVGEKGPELVNLPAHAQVVPNSALAAMRSPSHTIQIKGGDVIVQGDVSEQNRAETQQAIAQSQREILDHITRNLPQIQSDSSQYS